MPPAVPARTATAAPARHEADEPPARDDAAAFLLARGQALAAVDRAIATAGSGRGSLLVVEASAGAGKTSLLSAVTDRVLAADGHVVHGSGVGTGAMPALWPWVAIVRQVAALLPVDGKVPSPAADHALDVLAAGAGAPAGAAHSPGSSRTRLYRGVVDLILAARARRPLAVILDDLQWVDADSLDLLALAVDELIDLGVVLAVAVRTGEPGSDAAAAALRGVQRDAVVRLPLPGLAPDDVAAVLQRLTGRPADSELAAAIQRRTLGNPFFVGELVRLLVSEQRLTPQAVHDALPAEVEDVLRRRLDRLPERTRALLTVVALAGGPVDVDTLAAVTGLDPDAALDACESALLAELLVEYRTGFELRHDLIRQTLEHAVSSARRVRLHARLAESIQARPHLTRQDVVALARHLTLAEPVVGPAAPIPHLVAAAEDALTRNAHREAERLLEQALGLADRIPERDRAAVVTPVRGRLAIVRMLGRGALAEDAATDHADEVAPPATDEGAWGWVGALITRAAGGHWAEVAAITERALRADLPAAVRAGTCFVAGWAQFIRGRLDEAARHLDAYEALDPGARQVRPGGANSTLDVAVAGYRALVAHCLGDDAGADRAEQAAHARARGRDQPNGIEADLYSAWLAAMRGDGERTRTHARACLDAAARSGYPGFGLQAAVLAAWADAVLGDPVAVDETDEAYARSVASGILSSTPTFLLLRAEAHAVHGRLDRAVALVAEAVALSAELDDVPRAPRLLAVAEKLAPSHVQGLRKL